MGCGGTKEIEQPPNENLVQTDPNNLNYIETIVNEGKFLDFEETKSNIFLGVGVKKIHNYILVYLMINYTNFVSNFGKAEITLMEIGKF